MAELPKLNVKRDATEIAGEIQAFEEGRNFPFNEEVIIVAEGRQITSYKDLLEVANQEKNKGKKVLEVLFLPMIVGG
jgi:hypothetical protein